MENIPALSEMSVLRLPDDLTAIDEEAFMNDASLEAVIVPDGCQSIGARAFAGCVNLKYARIPADADVAEDVFEGCECILVDRVE